MQPEDAPKAVPGTPVGRRIVLGMIGLGALGVVFGRQLSQKTSEVAGAVSPQLQQALPALGGFRYYSVTSVFPEMSQTDWRMGVRTGLTDDTLTVLTFDDLAAMKQTQMTKDFQCVTGWRVEDVTWSGVLLADLLRETGADLNQPALRFTSFDNAYTESLTMSQAMRPDMLIATSLQGRPIDSVAGGPVRLVAAPMYGYKSIKWLDSISVESEVIPGYWELLGYDIDAWVGKSNGRSDEPVT